MAGTKISELDATNTEALRKKALGPRGCLAGLSADLTTINASGGYSVPFNTESYDTDAIHDNVTNNTRMTVPAGWAYVRVGMKVYVSNLTIANGFRARLLHFNSAGVAQSQRGLPGQFFANAVYTEACGSGNSAPIAVTAGDYFVVDLICSDTSITVLSSHTSAWMELLA